MHPPNLELSRLPNPLARYPLLTALRERRSRRFGLGMKMPAGPLTYQSSHQPAPLSEEAEAALVFAACGITGHALADLCYAKGEGGNIMGGLALQMDNSIEVGDWVKVGDLRGRVSEIRWRYTAIETRNWETVIVPNSVIMKKIGRAHV